MWVIIEIFNHTPISKKQSHWWQEKGFSHWSTNLQGLSNFTKQKKEDVIFVVGSDFHLFSLDHWDGRSWLSSKQRYPRGVVEA